MKQGITTRQKVEKILENDLHQVPELYSEKIMLIFETMYLKGSIDAKEEIQNKIEERFPWLVDSNKS